MTQLVLDLGIEQTVDIRDTWATPRDVFEYICWIWGYKPAIDVCADATNAKCPVHWDAQRDSLKIEWVSEAKALKLKPIFWMNPPYSQPTMTQFIEKAIEEASRGATTLFLLPAWPDREWYHDLILPHRHRFIRGRVPFEPPPGIRPSHPRDGSLHGVISKLSSPKDLSDDITHLVNRLTCSARDGGYATKKHMKEYGQFKKYLQELTALAGALSLK